MTGEMVQRMRPCAVSVMAILVLLSFGCRSTLSTGRLEYHDEYYVREPGRHCFEYERRFDGGSFVRGTIDYRITDVMWGDASRKGISYRMVGLVDLTGQGVAMDSHAAFELVPTKQVKEAMEPANVAEVFVEQSSEQGLVVTRIYRERLKSLRLPLEFRLEPTMNSPVDSRLMGRAREWAAEVGLVWLKDILLRLGLLKLDTRWTVTSIQETPDQAVLVFRQENKGGDDVFTLRFHRGRSLVRIDGVLADGSKLTLHEVASPGAPTKP